MTTDAALSAAVEVVDSGGLVVYPTETVYGLGGDALDSDAIESVFAAKRRDRNNPLSLAVPTVEAARTYVRPSATEQRFMHEFLPGPVTIVVEGRDHVPDALTGGHERVGVRIPDHDLASDLLERTGPLTATSANVSGRPSVTDPAELDSAIRTAAGAVLDGGETPGTASTVVDVDRGIIHRCGANADAVEDWLETHSA